MATYERLKTKDDKKQEIFNKIKKYFDNFEDEDRYLEEQMEIYREKNKKQERITGGW